MALNDPSGVRAAAVRKASARYAMNFEERRQRIANTAPAITDDGSLTVGREELLMTLASAAGADRCVGCNNILSADEIERYAAECDRCGIDAVRFKALGTKHDWYFLLGGIGLGLGLATRPLWWTTFALLIALVVCAFEVRRVRRIRRQLWCQGESRRWHVWREAVDPGVDVERGLLVQVVCRQCGCEQTRARASREGRTT
jgi:hypothetical protein